MKTLCILQGAPASGKSTFIREHKLEDYTLSLDKIRLMLRGYEMTTDHFAISIKDNKEVFEVFHRMLKYRMANGSFTVVDATHNREAYVNTYKKLAQEYGYRVYLVRFNVSFETLLERNDARKACGRYVPKDAIRRHYDHIQAFQDRSWYTVISPEEFENVVFQRFEHLDVPVVHIGDIHGCYSMLSQLKYDPNKKYVFLGDYFDRGSENGKVAKFLLEWMKYPNVVFLYGNHEHHLERYFKNGEFATKQFRASIEDIILEGVDLKALKTFFKKLVYVYCYEKDGKKVVCTHAGLPFMPEELRLVNPYDLSYGAGSYETNIDLLFQPEDPSIWQVHGHRNVRKLPAAAGPRSWNLNSAVEYGEPLRVLTLDKDWIVEKLEDKTI